MSSSPTTGHRASVAFPVSFLLLLAAACGARSDLWLVPGEIDSGSDASGGEDATVGADVRSEDSSDGGPPGDATLPEDAPVDSTPPVLEATVPDAPPLDAASCDGCCGEDACLAAPPVGTAIVLFGGVDDATLYGDTWLWQSGAWTAQSVAGPSKREGHAMASLGESVLLFGGWTSDGEAAVAEPLGDTWSWDGQAWTERATSGPSPRGDMAMAAVGGKVVLFGGLGPSGAIYGDTWIWDGTSWSVRVVSGPAAREGASIATLGGMAVLSGGYDDATVFVDTWGWDGDSWTELEASGPQEYEAAMATLGSEIVLSGWFQFQVVDGGLFNDTRLWNGSIWSDLSVEGPPIRQLPAMAATATEAILFGGFENGSPTGGFYADTWSWDGSGWSLLQVAGPSGRIGAAMASFDPAAGDP
jgi:hypothetical protein